MDKKIAVFLALSYDHYLNTKRPTYLNTAISKWLNPCVLNQQYFTN